MARFSKLMRMNMKMSFFLEVTFCIPVQIDRRFQGAFCLHHLGTQSISTRLKVVPLHPTEALGGEAV
jgi:hypothetical protein